MILMYHHVSPERPAAADARPDEGWDFHLSPQGFERQLRALSRRGLRFVPLPEIVETIRRGGREPDGVAAITFDDGWRDVYEHALPILLEMGLPATFFLTTEHLRPGRADARRLGRAQILELISAGMTVGGHSRTHVDLTRIPEARAREEIAGCRQDLEQATGQSVTLFAYPGGEFDRRVVELTREAGYAAACSTLGPARNDRASLFWMFRDLITEPMNSLGDRYRLSPWARRPLAWRVRGKVRRKLR
ncbi:MAG TPA: polysaccharide deacetylase family protein [Myxococcota bacterium]|nr:polysaccharide deacetylase family protein [Myxococcota bacterium]